MLAIRQFAAPDKDFSSLTLRGLSDRSELNGLDYDALKRDKKFQDDLNNFENQTVRTVVIRGWSEEKYLYSVFLRINTGSVQLSPQELRQALHPGPFADFIDEFSMDSVDLKNTLKLKQPDFRMRDVELVLRYYAYQNFLADYDGDLKNFLDNTQKILNKTWSVGKNLVERQRDKFVLALQTTRQIFGARDEFRKWNGSKYENRINRVVFDVMAYYFSNEAIAKESLKHAPAIKNKFEELCQEDRNFIASIEATTKSKEANAARFTIWAEALSSITTLKIESPLR